jgi:AcrR family transcriptional regulator
MRCVDRYGPEKTSLSDVARELGVTRQTLYRYFGCTEDLLAAVARTAVASYLDRLVGHLGALTDPVEVVVEALAYTIEHLPEEGYLGLLLSSDRSGRFFAGVTSPDAIWLACSLLDRAPVDWAGIGYDRGALNELAEFALRVLVSLVLDPGIPRRDGTEVRAFLRRWVGPAIVAGNAAALHGRALPRRRGAGNDDAG